MSVGSSSSGCGMEHYPPTQGLFLWVTCWAHNEYVIVIASSPIDDLVSWPKESRVYHGYYPRNEGKCVKVLLEIFTWIKKIKGNIIASHLSKNRWATKVLNHHTIKTWRNQRSIKHHQSQVNQLTKLNMEIKNPSGHKHSSTTS